MSPAAMRRARQVHTYLGVFFAPSVIFFAFTGALQTFGLHENKGSGLYRPPAWIVTLASVHKDQQLPSPKRPPPIKAEPKPGAKPKEGAAKQGAQEGPPPQSGPSPLPLKVFTLLLSIGLISTTLVGLYLALSNKALRKIAAVVLAAGLLAPAVLLFL